MSLSFYRPTASPRRRMNMFYLLDTSASMKYKNRLKDLNRAMRDVLPILRDVSTQNHDMCDIYLSCIQFGNEARLIDAEPVDVHDYEWRDVEASGYTNLRDAFALLEQQMHRGEAMSSNTQHVRPAVFLVSDGDPDDGWREGLEALQRNEWFKQAYKIAIAIGCKPENIAMQAALNEFSRPLSAGGDPIIINVQELGKLHDVIRIVSATVSRVGTRAVPQRGTDVATAMGQEIRATLPTDDGGILVNNPNQEGSYY